MKISVALCTYNGGKYLALQLQSIFDQMLPVDEIVICDDGSTDNTVEIVKAFSGKHPGIIQLHINEQNLRVNKNFEKAIGLCTGDVIFLSDQDDLWKKEKTKNIVGIFDEKPELEGVFSDGDLIDDDGNNTGRGTLWGNVQFFDKYIKGEVDLYYYISFLRNMVTGAALAIKKEARQHIFPFPDKSVIFHDEWIGLNLGYRKTLGFTSECLFSYRVHSAQQIGVIKHSSLQRHVGVVNNILGYGTKQSFKDLLHIRKSFYRNYSKFKKLNESYSHPLKFPLDTIIDENKRKVLLTEKKMLKSNFMLYLFHKTVDKISGKRQFT